MKLHAQQKYSKSTGSIDVRLVDELDDVPEQINQIDPTVIHESELMKAFREDPSTFERTSIARKSSKRAVLRNITQLTDEQLEGWYIMFQRNPRKDKLLKKHEWSGQQTDISTEEGGSSLQNQHQKPRQYRDKDKDKDKGRGGSLSSPHDGRGSKGQQTGGNGTQTSSNTSRERAQKEKHKGRGANHNRKNAHAKKMGKGFGSFQPDS